MGDLPSEGASGRLRLVDQPRFLGRTHGYSDRPTVDAVEAVDADEQARQTALAHRRAELDRRQEWVQSRNRIRAELDHLRELYGSFVSGDVRQVRHVLDRIDARVRAR
jgi:hypothetical protein